MKLNPKQTP